MSTTHFHYTTISTPEQFVAGLTDFGPARSKLFRNSAREYLKVHHRGPSEADVTEGSGGIWERLHYDWSDSDRVVMTTTDSNVWGGRSSHTYTFTRLSDGTTGLDAVVVREGKNLRGRVLGFVLGPLASTFWTRRLQKASRPSKPAIARRALARVECANCVSSVPRGANGCAPFPLARLSTFDALTVPHGR